MASRLTLAVAGARKTQGIVDYCTGVPTGRRVLILTYTHTNQQELLRRLAQCAGDHPRVSVSGWYAFLLRDMARPFLPFRLPGRRVRGFNFDGQPSRYATGMARFLDGSGAVYRCELARLASELVEASSGALLRRLEAIYDEIIIDEVQDLSAHDWTIIDVLLGSTTPLWMVGDLRQAVLSTNPRSRKNSRYAYADVIRWFREREAGGLLTIEESTTTWRCHPTIASFADSIFDASWGFAETRSVNATVSNHDGVFLVRSADVAAYVRRFQPLCMRDNIRSGARVDIASVNFGLAKGMNCTHALIIPTGPIQRFIQHGVYLPPLPASRFYVAVTRAEQSVGIVLDSPAESTLPYWSP